MRGTRRPFLFLALLVLIPRICLTSSIRKLKKESRALKSELDRLREMISVEQISKRELEKEMVNLRKESMVCQSELANFARDLAMMKNGLTAEKGRLHQLEEDFIEWKYNLPQVQGQSVAPGTVSQACTKHTVPNYSFELDSNWIKYGTSGFLYTEAEAYDGQRSAQVDNGGCNQNFVFSNSVKKFIFSGYSKNSGVTGVEGADYSVYCDIKHSDDTWTYGESSHFKTGSAGHSWHRAVLQVSSQKDIEEAWCYGLFRGHNHGTAYFDKFEMWTMNEGTDFSACNI